MTRASPLEAAAQKPEGSDEMPIADRRLTDSNAAWLGKIVDGRYRVIEVIGRGGMGVVYRVEHLRMGKIAAMKVLHRDLASDPEVISRFEREAAAVSKLHHPHTVQVFDFGTANGALYLIMEYVRGLDMAHIIQRDGPMPWSRAAPLLAQICGGLQEAHELGIVHRDLKPENVLITRTAGGRDYAKVLDFGLAKLEQRKEPTTETDRQAIVGTPYFMSPEQIRGDNVDARSDIYSFGALMFELLTGQHLFTGSTAVGVLTKHLTADPDAPSNRATKLGIDPRVDQVCLKCLAKDPSARWQSAEELAEAIEEVYTETVGYSTGPGARSSNRIGAGRLVVTPDDSESNLRLRRSDIDAYERGLKRARYVSLGIVGGIVLAGVGAAAYYMMREPPPLTEEREPNNDAPHANKIAAGTQVTGTIGKRRSTTDGDVDYFLVPYSSASKRVVTVRVTGLPNIDINLAITDEDGLHGANADEAQLGEGEVLHRRAVDGPLVISVGETLAKNERPIENVSDPYTLTVTEEPLAGETEPNGREPDANALEPTIEMRGYLDTRDDVDLLRWQGTDGTYNIIVRADGIPLVWHTADGKLRTPGAVPLHLAKGELITLERSDRGAKGPLPARDNAWSVVVTPVP
ncbi:MAG: serine/threonine protein kinase [Deltaproteobacteria bacterium]|nr:serine/threonine protein kinase [Deltaproteobacteria bacterium]